MRDAIQAVKLKDSLLGPIAFDENGDLKNKIISVFQIKKDDDKPLDDPTRSTSTSAWPRWPDG